MKWNIDTCPVCLERQHVVMFPCSHGMCANCLTRMLEHDGRCCICRMYISSCVPAVVTKGSNTVTFRGEDPSDLFGICLDESLYVIHVRRHSVAERMAVHVGDLLLGVNGIPCRNKGVVLSTVSSTTQTCCLVFRPKRCGIRLRRWLHRIRVSRWVRR